MLGLFDVSHMGTLKLSGKGALETLQKIGTNDFASMKSGDVRYTPMCQENGGVLDDFIVYCYEDHYRVIINASNRESDEQWIRQHLAADSVLESLSDETAILALQGPKSHDILSQLLSSEDLPTKNSSLRWLRRLNMAYLPYQQRDIQVKTAMNYIVQAMWSFVCGQTY